MWIQLLSRSLLWYTFYFLFNHNWCFFLRSLLINHIFGTAIHLFLRSPQLFAILFLLYWIWKLICVQFYRWCNIILKFHSSLCFVHQILILLGNCFHSNQSSRWNKLVQKPFEEGDERGLKLVQSILKPIMLRRTKSSTDRDGRYEL